VPDLQTVQRLIAAFSPGCNQLLAVMRIWLWHKVRDAVTDSYDLL